MDFIDEIKKKLENIISNEIILLYYNKSMFGHIGHLILLIIDNNKHISTTSLPYHMTLDILKILKENTSGEFIKIFNDNIAFSKVASFKSNLNSMTIEDKELIFIKDSDIFYVAIEYGILSKYNINDVIFDNTKLNLNIIDEL